MADDNFYMKNIVETRIDNIPTIIEFLGFKVIGDKTALLLSIYVIQGGEIRTDIITIDITRKIKKKVKNLAKP